MKWMMLWIFPKINLVVTITPNLNPSKKCLSSESENREELYKLRSTIFCT